ncbi:hypothetical protein RRG08_020541 [Elysia crispata]|uniref:Ig-like domain-containing protein n=1 Tax=Elysia crispata TaxID=231223 RepID=A0AAE0YZU4_9GAST|nr:hypothetical protein RRG08_020541 [Elysia crispata]
MFNILYAPQVIFTLDPAQATFSKGDNLEFKCSGQGNPEPTLTLTKTETNKDLIIVQTTELTHTLTLSCTDTGVYACSGQNSQGTTEQEISIGVSCRQQLSPLFYLTHKVDPAIEAIIGETAHIDLEIYGYPEPTALTLQRLYDDTDLTSSPRHSVTYTASAAPFGAVNVTISDLVEADLTIYILTVDNGVGEALKYIFHLNQVDANEDALNIAAIVIAVIAVVIIAGLVVVIIFLLKKIRGPKDRLNSKCSDPRESDPQKKQNDDQLIPLEMPTTKDTTPVSAKTAQYETIQYMTSTSGTYNSTSPQNVEAPNFYMDLEPNHATIGNYSNVSN